MPFHAAGLPALATYNLALLFGFAFAGYGAWVLARQVTGCTPAALLAGIFFAFCSYKFAHIQHVQIVWSGWLPLMLAALLAYWRRPDNRRAALLGGAFLMNGLTNIHWLLFGGFMLLVTIGFLAAADPRRERAFWWRMTGALAIASLLLLPALVPYVIVKGEYASRRTTGEARPGSASLSDWLIASPRSRIYGGFADRTVPHDERELFPGLLVLFLAGYGLLSRSAAGRVDDMPAQQRSARLVRTLDALIVLGATVTCIVAFQGRVTIGRFSFVGADVPAMITVALLIWRLFPRLRQAVRTSRFTPEEWTAGMWVIIGFVASLGWNAFLHPFLFRVITPFRATRTPARWAVIVYVGLAVWAAIGMAALLRRTKRRRVVAAALLLVAIAEVAPVIRWQHVDVDAPVYDWLARVRPRVAFELPMVGEGVPYEYLLASSKHRVPLINGVSGWEPPLHEHLRKKEEKLEYDREFLSTLERSGCEIIIVHEARMSEERTAALAPLLRQLRPRARFGDDVVYMVK